MDSNTIEISTLQSAIYFVTVNISKGSISKRVIIE
ncbi:T9SS type A sorting domain-containing protein [Patiriisocius sp. Uisw_017]